MFQLPLDAADPVSSVGQRYLTLREGSRVGGRYRLGALIERGPELAIFEALDEQSSREVLIRLRPSSSVPDARLEHPGIAQFADCGCIGTWFVGVLDPGEGEALSQVLRSLTVDHVPLDELTALGVDLLAALDSAHTHGLAHGNLGIHSLHLTPTWGAVILDFPESIERLRDEALPFASPERLNGQRGDERSDVYAVAALLYSLGAGEPPFGLSPHQARDGHLYQPLPPHAAVPVPLFHVLATAMSKRPEHRYPTAAGFSAALLEAFQEIRTAEERQARTRDDYGESSQALALAVDAVAHEAWHASDEADADVDAADEAPVSDVSDVAEVPSGGGDSVLDAGGYDLDEPVIDTMDPAPIRSDEPAGPTNDAAGRMSRSSLLGRDEALVTPNAANSPISPELAELEELEELESQGGWLPAMLLAVLCLLAAGIAGFAVLLAGGLFALTSVTDQIAERSTDAPVVASTDAPVVAMPDVMADAAAAGIPTDASKTAAATGGTPTLAEKAEAAAAKAPSARRTGNWDGRTSDPGVSARGDMRVPVTFAYDSFEATAEPGFAAFMTAANTHEGRVRLTGHTDSLGSAQANRLMGLGRAWSVSMLMVAKGYDEGRVDLLSGGEDLPVADNSTEEGRAENRRVTAEFAQERKVSDLLVTVQ